MSLFRNIAVVTISVLLTGCGFQLRTQPNIPPEMSRTYIATDDSYSLFYRAFRDELAKAGVDVVSSPADATAVFSILADVTDQRVLSVSALNVPREKLPHIYIDCGTDDRLLRGARELAELLREHNIAFTYAESPGGHRSDYWRREVGHSMAVQYSLIQRNLNRSVGR